MEIDIFQLPGILRRRWIYPVAAAVVFGLLAIAFVMHQTPLYHASVELIVDPTGLQNPALKATETQSSGQGDLTTDSQIYIMQSVEVLSAVVKKLHLQDDSWLAPAKTGGLLSALRGAGKMLTEDQRKQEAVAALRNDITVVRANQSLVFSITMKHPSATKAADIANAVASVYLKLINENRSGTALRASMSLQAQADELRQRLQKAQNEVETFKAKHGLFSTAAKGLVSDQEIETLSQQIATANMKVESQKTIYDQASKLSMADIQAGSIPEALQSSALVSLRTRYAQLLETEAQLAANLGKDHPQLKAARSQVASMRGSIKAELERVRTSLKNNYLRAKADLAALKDRYKALAKATGESGDARTRLAQLESNANALKALYQSYLSKAEDLGGQQSFDPGASRIISPASPPSKASGAPKSLTLVAGLLFGGMLGAALAVLLELIGGVLPTINPQEPRQNNQKPTGKTQKRRDTSSIPIVARLSSPDTGGGVLGHLFKRVRRGNAGDMSRELGLERIAKIVRTAFADEPVKHLNILFVPAQGMLQEEFPLEDLAEAMADPETNVHYCDGREPEPVGPVLVRNGPRVALAVKSQPDLSLWGHGRLQFETVVQNLPLLSAYLRKTDYYLVDAGSDAAQSMFAQLIEGADAVFAVSYSDTRKRDLEALNETLAPWSDRLLGMIVLEA